MTLNEAIADGWLVGYEIEEMPVPIVLSDKQAEILERLYAKVTP